jgi:hypothetical protein
VIGGKPINVLLQSISSVSAINPLVAYYDIMEERQRCYSFILSRTPQDKIIINNILNTPLLIISLLYFSKIVFQVDIMVHNLCLNAYLNEH